MKLLLGWVYCLAALPFVAIGFVARNILENIRYGWKLSEKFMVWILGDDE